MNKDVAGAEGALVVGMMSPLVHKKEVQEAGFNSTPRSADSFTLYTFKRLVGVERCVGP